MKSPARQKSAKQPQAQATLPALTLTAQCVALLFMSAGTAFAQTTQDKPKELETVTVTGIRKGIESAISVKKSSDSIVEAISAEDIGKLPDTSIAESIARLPGVAAQRTAGRAQQISIRGMSPDFSTNLLNGREQVSTGDSRSAEFDQYPSELLSGVVIYKTPDGALVGQGLSGTVDLQTVRPLDFAQRAVAVNYRKQRLGVGTIAEGKGDKFSLSYIDQFADRKIGIAVGFARLDEEGATTSRFESWGGGTTTYNGQTVNVPYNGFNAWADQTTQTRDGAMAVVQFRPNKNFSSTLDLFYSTFDKVKATKGFQAPLNDSWNPPANGNYDSAGVLSNATLSGSDVTAGTFNNVRAVVRNDVESVKDQLAAFGWNNKLALGEDWMLNADLSYSKAKRRGAIIETTAGTAQSTLGTAALDSVAFTNAGSFSPGFNYTDRSIIKLTDVQGWGGGVGSPQAGYSKLPNVVDKLSSVRLDAKRNLPEGWFLSDVDVGINVADRKKTRAFVEGRLVIRGDTTGLGAADMPGADSLVVSGIPIATFDPLGTIGTIYDVVSKKHPDIFNKDWTVKEKVTTLFSKANIDTRALGMPVRGNVGLQFVKTDQSSVAFNVDRSTCINDQNCPSATASTGTSYNDVLPSLNLAFEPGRDQTVRLGVARVMARPTINDMRASSAFGFDTGKQVLVGEAGNPMLKPFRATALDLSYEKYFGTKAYIGVAGFYKKLSTYILKVTDPAFDFAPFVTPGTVLPPSGSTIGEFTQPVNGSGGTIKGIELSASLPFNMLTPMLDGFGVQATYSDTSSSINLRTAGVAVDNITSAEIPLPGLSKRVSNLTFYYEKYGFSARVAQRQRSAFVGEVADFAGDRRLTFIKAEKIVDLQLGYEIQSGPAKGLSLLFQANNLTDAEFVRFKDIVSNEVERVKYGKTYLFGLNYKL